MDRPLDIDKCFINLWSDRNLIMARDAVNNEIERRRHERLVRAFPCPGCRAEVFSGTFCAEVGDVGHICGTPREARKEAHAAIRARRKALRPGRDVPLDDIELLADLIRESYGKNAVLELETGPF